MIYLKGTFVARCLQWGQRILKRIVRLRSFPFFLTLHLRPKYRRNIRYNRDISAPPGQQTRPTKEIGLVIQGPLLGDNDFTLESVRLYKETFPRSVVIVSTWDDSDADCVAQLKAEGIEVLLNEKPSWTGYSHVNYQITSSLNGIRRAKQLNLQYALKSRTDQRVYAPNAEEFLLGLLDTFPVADGCAQRQRIVVTSLCSFINSAYWVSDMLSFGQIDDMLLLWDVELLQKPAQINFEALQALSHETASALHEHSHMRPETFLMVQFLKKLGYAPAGTREECFRMYGKHLCVIDQESLDLFWGRPELELREYLCRTYHALPRDLLQLTHRDWLPLYRRYRTGSN